MGFFLLVWCAVTALVNGQTSNDIACTNPPQRLSAASGVIDYPTTLTAHCQWLIEVDTGKLVSLSFTSIDMEEEYEDVCEDAVKVYDGNSSNAAFTAHCGTANPEDITSTGNVILLEVSSDSSAGFEIRWTAVDADVGITTACTNPPLKLNGTSGIIEYPEGSGNYGNNDHCQWLIEVQADHKIRLSFLHIDVEQFERVDVEAFPDNPGCYDVVKVHHGSTTNDPFVGYCGTTLPPHFKSIGNVVLVEFISGGSNVKQGFALSWTSIEDDDVIVSACTFQPLRLNRVSGVIAYPAGAQRYNNYERCQWLIEVEPGHKVRFWFTRLDVEGTSGAGCYDYVKVYDGNNTSAAYKMYCGTSLPGDFRSSGNVILVRFVSDHTTRKTGFEAIWTTAEEDGVIANACTNPPLRLYEASGTIQYPQGQEEYGSFQNCQWVIEVEAEYLVRLSFSAVDVEERPNRRDCNDVVNVYDGKDTHLLLTAYCGSIGRSDVTSTGNNVLIQFLADPTVTQHGFELSWTAIKETDACTDPPLRLNGTSGTIDYPDGSGNYGNDKHCQWLIEVEAGYKVRLSFLRIYTEGGRYRCFDPLIVYDGNSTNAQSTEYCGEYIVNPGDFTTTGNVMLIEFTSDYEIGKTGFEVSWRTVEENLEPNPRCWQQCGVHKAPGDEWLTTSADGRRHKWCVCPAERPVGVELHDNDFCIGACLWADGPHSLDGNNYHLYGETWDYLRDNIGYTFECVCSVNGGQICDVKAGGHICTVHGEVHYPGDMDFIVEVGDVYSDRYEECDCPDVLPVGVSRWKRDDYCKGVCFDEDNTPHYEGESYVDRNHKCFLYNCTCHDHGGRECHMDVNGGHQCILDKERYNPGVTWRRRTYQRNGLEAGYQECTCPMVWPHPRSTYFSPGLHCRGICYENATTIFYQDDSPYIRTDINTGEQLTCKCFNAGVEFCHRD